MSHCHISRAQKSVMNMTQICLHAELMRMRVCILKIAACTQINMNIRARAHSHTHTHTRIPYTHTTCTHAPHAQTYVQTLDRSLSVSLFLTHTHSLRALLLFRLKDGKYYVVTDKWQNFTGRHLHMYVQCAYVYTFIHVYANIYVYTFIHVYASSCILCRYCEGK